MLIPMHRAALLQPFTAFLDEIGAPVARGLERAGLPLMVLEDLVEHVPSYQFYAFVHEMARSEGIEDLGFEVGKRFGETVIDLKLAQMMNTASTLYLGIKRAIEVINKSTTRGRAGILERTDIDIVHFYYKPSCDRTNPASQHLDWYAINVLLGIVRVFAGPEWTPPFLGLLQSHRPPDRLSEQFGDGQFRMAQPFSYFSIPKSILSFPPADHIAIAPDLRVEAAAEDLSVSLKQALCGYLEKHELNVDFSAELCGVSKRTLQRQLAAAGTTYARVLEQARFDVASRMLRDPDVKIRDIAFNVGYGDQTNFGRAFKRVSGLTPRSYRNALLQEVA